MSSFFVPTRFTWRFGGNQVHLCGSFTRWVETVPMAAVEGSPGVFAVVVHLPPGYHQYKFIVDGEWRHDETQPFMPDPLGNVNNWLFVRQQQQPPGGGSAGASSSSNPHALPGLQQQPLPGHPGLPAGQSDGGQQLPQQQVPPQQQLLPARQPPAAARQAAGQPVVPQPVSQQPQSPAIDTDMAAADGSEGVVAPMLAAREPEFTRRAVREFLRGHTAYELIPESGKVVLLDTDLPVRQAFHALHDQGVASAPVWDSEAAAVVGMISASDFIHMLSRLRSSAQGGANAMSEAEMDQHTIRGMREEAAAEGREPRALVSVTPSDHLGTVIDKLFHNRCSMAPVLASETTGGTDGGSLLHIATMSGVLGCLMRHFRASLASLPLLAQPVGSLALGTWAPDSPTAQRAQQPPAEAAAQGNAGQQTDGGGQGGSSSSSGSGGGGSQGGPGPRGRRFAPLHCVTAGTPLTRALNLLLEAGVSALPVVDEAGVLLNIYARGDITTLAKGNAYSRLQWEDVTVGQALTLAAQPPPGSHPALQVGEAQAQRVFMCTARDALRAVVERLAVPGVRRLIVVEPDTRRVEGVISLSDVASFLFL